jgi:hypothetical protein
MINIGIGIPFGQRSAGIDPQAKIAFDSLQSAGFTTPQGITGINAAFKTIKTIYGTSDITTAISFFGDPSLAYQIGAGSGTTLGQAIRTLPNIIDPTRATDAVQTTAASQPLLLVHSGANYYFNDDTGASSISKSISNISTGTNYVFEFGLNSSFVAGNIRTIAGHGTSNGTSIWIRWGSNTLVFDYRNPRVEVASNTLNANSRFFKIEFTKNSAIGYTITFSEKINIGDSYTINRTATVTGTTTAIDAINTAWMGSLGSSFGLLGKLLFVNCTVDGNPIYNFQASNYVASASQTTLPDNVSGTWTINTGTATTGYKGVLVDRTMTMFDAIDDTISNTDTTTFRTTFVSLKVHRTGSFFAGVINNNTGSVNAASQWFYTGETANIVDANNALLDTRYINNVINSSYTPYRLFLGQIDLGATPNTANGKLIGFLASNNYLCGIMTSCIQTYNNPTPTQRTEMYNYIRSINGNSF